MRRDSATVQNVMPEDVQVYPRAQMAEQHGESIESSDDPEAAPVSTISLQRILLDGYEFQGLKEMLYFVLFFVCIVVFVWMQWSSTGAVFRSTIVESVRSWDNGNDWESSQLKNLESVEDALDYYMGYLQSIQSKTQGDGLNNKTLWIGEYAEVSYIRLLVDFSTYCEKKKNTGWRSPERNNRTNGPAPLEECFVTALDPDTANGADEHERVWKFKRSGRWSLPPGSTDLGLYSATLFSRNANMSSNRSQTVGDRLMNMTNSILEEDRGVIGTYAASVILEMLAINRIGRDAVFVSVSTGVKGLRNGHKLLTRMLVSTINTLKPDNTPPSMNFWVMLTFCLLAGALNLLLLRREAGVARLCALQSGSVWSYFRYRWNQLTLFGFMIALGFLLSFFFIMGQKSYSYDDLMYNMTDQEFVKMRREADDYTLWLYFGLFLMGWEGMCMLRFMRVHGGLKTFYQVFTYAFKWLVDFFVFVLYVFLVLGLLVFGGFQISGGNPLFVEYGTGFSAMARLQFQLLSFDEFTAQYLGFGSAGGVVVEMLFWATVIMLVVFVANILLAIFTSAYDTARRNSLETESTFLGMVLQRIWFSIVKVVLDFVWFPFLHWIVDQRGNLQYNEHDVRTNPTSRLRTYFETLLDESRHTKRLAERKWDLLQARWLLAQRDSLQALVAFYTDFGTLKLIKPHERPHWLVIEGNGETVPGGRVQPICQERIEREVPFMGQELTSEEFHSLMDFLHEMQGRLQVKGWLLHFFLSSHQFKTLNEQVVLKNVRDVMRVYQYVPKPKRDLDGDGVDDEETDPVTMLKKMQQHIGSLESNNSDMKQQLSTLLASMQHMMQAQHSITAQQRQQSGGRITPRQWADDV